MNKRKRLGIITSHPIQYNAPWFRLLQERQIIEIKVFYTRGRSQLGRNYDVGFKKYIEWDIPLLTGYSFDFVPNQSKNPSSKNYFGIKNATLITDIENWGPDALLIFGWKFQSHLHCLRHFFKKLPILFRGDSTLLDDRSGVRRIFRAAVLKWVYHHVDYALYTGTENKRYFLRYGVKEKQLILVPHAIDNDRFAPSASQLPEIEELRNRLDIKANEVVILFAGKIEAKKDPELLITAFSRCNVQCKKLVIVGDGPLGNKLKEKYGARQNIVFLEFTNQMRMPLIYRLADIFVLPSKGPGESWGLSVNEALASGTPVLVSDMCGCAIDLVNPGQNGFIFQSGNVNDLVKRIELMMKNRSNLEEMRIAALQNIKNWSFLRIATEIEKLMAVI